MFGAICDILDNYTIQKDSYFCSEDSIKAVLDFMNKSQRKFIHERVDWLNLEGCVVFVSWVEDGEIDSISWEVVY